MLVFVSYPMARSSLLFQYFNQWPKIGQVPNHIRLWNKKRKGKGKEKKREKQEKIQLFVFLIQSGFTKFRLKGLSGLNAPEAELYTVTRSQESLNQKVKNLSFSWPEGRKKLSHFTHEEQKCSSLNSTSSHGKPLTTAAVLGTALLLLALAERTSPENSFLSRNHTTYMNTLSTDNSSSSTVACGKRPIK